MGHHHAPIIHCRRSLSLVAAVLLAASGYWGTVLAQDTTGSIEGVVSGPEGKPLGGVEVIATMSAPKVERRATTNRDGAFRIPALPLGAYELSIQSLGYWPATVRSVVVRLGRSTAVPPVELSPVDEIVENVEVFAEAPLIDPSTTTTGGNIAADVFDNLPVTRDYQSIAALLPNVSVSYLGDPINIGGATGQENRYFVDGIDMTEPGRMLGGTALPPDFIQEVEVKTGGYEAEYRSALGGIVNVVTPSGSDRFSGKLIGYWTSHLVSEDPKQSPIALQQKDFAQYDAGFSLSGPLAKDRAWFFVAYDPMVQKVDTEIPGIGYYRDSSTAHRFAGKVDWRVHSANQLSLTITGDPQSRDGVGDYGGISPGMPVSLLNPDPYLRRIEGGGVGVSVRGTHVLSPRLLLESSLSNLWRRDRNLPATERGRDELLFIDKETGVWSGGSGAQFDLRNSQLTAGVKATWIVERHEIKFGAEYRDNTQSFDAFNFGWLNRYSDSSFETFESHVGGELSDVTTALFVQDSWRLGSRWVLNAGLRWADEKLNGGAHGVVQHLNYEWQPRVGFVYQPGKLGTQRVFGSAARYYQEVATAGVSYWVLGQVFSGCFYDHDPRVDPTGGDCYEIPGGPQAFDKFDGYHFDDYSLGYQRQIGERHRFGVRAIYRTLGDAVEDSCDLEVQMACFWGNPGHGDLAFMPRATRVFKALEITAEGQPTARSGYLASYVLSENRGNYAGLYWSQTGYTFPGASGLFDAPELLINATGLLPNDRTHVLKGSGFYRFSSGVNAGASLLWASGTPLSELGGAPPPVSVLSVFLQERGSVGRTPSFFDLSLRVDYTFFRNSTGRFKPRLLLDVYHLFGGRKAVDYDQVHYFNVDDNGNQIDPNPTYGMATRYYPPTTARLGLEVTF